MVSSSSITTCAETLHLQAFLMHMVMRRPVAGIRLWPAAR
jgi:hypothetical protein